MVRAQSDAARQGEIDEVLEVMKRCLEAMATDCDRITYTAKLDHRKGHRGRLESKVRSVEQKLGRTLRTTESQDRQGQ